MKENRSESKKVKNKKAGETSNASDQWMKVETEEVTQAERPIKGEKKWAQECNRLEEGSFRVIKDTREFKEFREEDEENMETMEVVRKLGKPRGQGGEEFREEKRAKGRGTRGTKGESEESGESKKLEGKDTAVIEDGRKTE